MFIHSAVAHITAPAEVRDLKEELGRHTDIHFRRVSKFVLLALIGACSCAARRTPDKDTAIYVTTENGNLADTESVLSQIYRQHSLPMPFNFINTMTNTAAFYVAQGLGLCGRNMSVSSQNLSFERGMELLKADMETGTVRHALIGLVDEATPSASRFTTSSGVVNDRINQIDRSCWLYVKAERAGAIGEIAAVRSFKTQEEACRWLEENPASLSPDTEFSFGAAMGPEEKGRWMTRLQSAARRPAIEFDYIRESGHYNVTTACGIVRFLQTSNTDRLFHINRNFSDQHVIMEIIRY